jgi:hypothetical protein
MTSEDMRTWKSVTVREPFMLLRDAAMAGNAERHDRSMNHYCQFHLVPGRPTFSPLSMCFTKIARKILGFPDEGSQPATAGPLVPAYHLSRHAIDLCLIDSILEITSRLSIVILYERG